MTGFLPTDAERATLLGRMEFGDGPTPVLVRQGRIQDLSAVAPTVADLLNQTAPGENLIGVDRGVFASDDCLPAWKGGARRLLAPIDLQCIKAAGVTFARPARAGDRGTGRATPARRCGRAQRARAHRRRPATRCAGIRRGGEASKAALIAEGLWSPVPRGRHRTGCRDLHQGAGAVGSRDGADVGVRPDSAWNNPEPEVVIVCDGQGRASSARRSATT